MLHYPLLVEHKKCSLIKDFEFKQESNLFFKYLIYKKRLKFTNSTVDSEFIVNMTKASFYQLVFSLLFNLINILEVESSLEIKFQVKNKKLQKITISYIAFQLNLEQIASYTELQNQGEVFLLNMRQIIKGLELYGFFIEINNESNGKNIIELLCQKTHAGNDFKDNKIVNLKDYLNK